VEKNYGVENFRAAVMTIQRYSASFAEMAVHLLNITLNTLTRRL
jgi:hypothetical protein